MTRQGRGRHPRPSKLRDIGMIENNGRAEKPVQHGDPEKLKLVGRRVKTLKMLRTMLCVMPVGSYCTITATHRGRFTLRGSDELEIFIGVRREWFEVLP